MIVSIIAFNISYQILSTAEVTWSSKQCAKKNNDKERRNPESLIKSSETIEFLISNSTKSINFLVQFRTIHLSFIAKSNHSRR